MDSATNVSPATSTTSRTAPTGEHGRQAGTRAFPVPDKAEWRDPRVAQSYVDEALASDPTSGDRELRT